MRWLFLIMLVLNLSYIAWGMLNTSSQNVRMSAPPLPDVPTILLADEGEGAEILVKKDVHASPVPDMAVDGEPLNTASFEDNSEINQRPLAAATDELPLPKTATDTDIGEPEVFAQLQSGEAVELIKAEKVPVFSPSSESTSAKLENRQEQGGVQIRAPEECFTLGPFRELDTLRALTRKIKEYVAEVGFRSRDEKESSLFWVYLPPLKDKAQAKETGKRLKAKKIKDYYIIRSGDKANGISLGQFRNKDGAYGLAKKVTKLGFTVEVEPIFKTYTLYWLDYRLINSGSIPESITADYLTAKISRLSRSCHPLATETF